MRYLEPLSQRVMAMGARPGPVTVPDRAGRVGLKQREPVTVVGCGPEATGGGGALERGPLPDALSLSTLRAGSAASGAVAGGWRHVRLPAGAIAHTSSRRRHCEPAPLRTQAAQHPIRPAASPLFAR